MQNVPMLEVGRFSAGYRKNYDGISKDNGLYCCFEEEEVGAW